MNTITKSLAAGFIALAITVSIQSDASAQYPLAVQPVVPAVVGYTAERRGLFGRRIVYRPFVAPVATVVPVTPTVTVARPVFAAPVVSAPVTVRYAPTTTAPITTYYRAPAPVTTYYRAPAPVVQVQSYRVPVTYIYGF